MSLPDRPREGLLRASSTVARSGTSSTRWWPRARRRRRRATVNSAGDGDDERPDDEHADEPFEHGGQPTPLVRDLRTAEKQCHERLEAERQVSHEPAPADRPAPNCASVAQQSAATPTTTPEKPRTRSGCSPYPTVDQTRTLPSQFNGGPDAPRPKSRPTVSPHSTTRPDPVTGERRIQQILSRWLSRVSQATSAVETIRSPTTDASPRWAHSAKIWGAEYGELVVSDASNDCSWAVRPRCVSSTVASRSRYSTVIVRSSIPPMSPPKAVSYPSCRAVCGWTATRNESSSPDSMPSTTAP